MALFSLIAKLGLDKTGFDAGIKAAATTSQRFGSALKSQFAAAFGTAAIVAYTKSLVEYASQVKDASTRTGASTEALQTLGYAAKQTGSDFEAVVRSFKDLSKARQEALADPRSKAAQVFRAMGIDGEKLKNLKLEDLFREIGRSFQTNDFGASELAMVTELLGKAGAELLPAMKEGLGELEQAARDAGVVLGDELIGPLEQLGDEFETLTGQLRGPFAEALVFVLKLANDLLSKLKTGFETLTNFAEGFKEGFGEAQQSRIPKWLRVITGFGAIDEMNKKIARGVEKGREQVGQAADEAAKEEAPEDGFLFGFKKDVEAGERRQRRFNFEKLIRAAGAERAPRLPQADALGRIGGTIGGGNDATQTKLTELVREMKELRRTLEMRGINIRGEL